jgi:hypothetical protein
LSDVQFQIRRGRPLYLENNDNPPSDFAALLDQDADNPSAPYRNRLDDLRDLLTDDVIPSGGSLPTSGQFASALTGSGVTFQDTNRDFIQEGVTKGDYVVISKRDNTRDDQNRGYYQVTEVENDELHVDGTSVPYQSRSPQNETNLTYRIVHPEEAFGSKTVGLVLDQIADIERTVEYLDRLIRLTIHEPNDFESTGDRGGDPQDTLLNQIRGDLTDRYEWVSGQNSVIPFLRNEIRKTLSSREKLYDTRYAWIDYRINRENGKETMKRRFQNRKEANDEQDQRQRQRRQSLEG